MKTPLDAFLQEHGRTPARSILPTIMTGPPQAPPHVRTCPFCGLVTDMPHEAQEACIAALQAEVSRMRALLDQLKPAGAPPTLSADSNSDT